MQVVGENRWLLHRGCFWRVCTFDGWWMMGKAAQEGETALVINLVTQQGEMCTFRSTPSVFQYFLCEYNIYPKPPNTFLRCSFIELFYVCNILRFMEELRV